MYFAITVPFGYRTEIQICCGVDAPDLVFHCGFESEICQFTYSRRVRDSNTTLLQFFLSEVLRCLNPIQFENLTLANFVPFSFHTLKESSDCSEL